jgi:hypothetical protein
MARKFTDIEILESLVKQFGDNADSSAWSNIRAKLEEAQPQANNSIDEIDLYQDALECLKGFHPLSFCNAVIKKLDTVIARLRAVTSNNKQKQLCLNKSVF